MGQKVHPNGMRIGVIKDWSSKWYADSKNFSDYLIEDQKIRKYVKQKLFIGITNFLTAAYLVSPKEKDFSKCFISFFAMLLFWILTIAYSKIKKRKIFDK